jgi:ATP-binding cassette, subfamily B, bacterial
LLKDASLIGAKLRLLAAQLPYLPRAMQLVWTAARGWTAAWIAVLVVQGLLPIATVYLTRAVVNRLMPALRSGGSWETLRPLIVAASLMALVLLVSEALRGLAGALRAAQADLVQDYISSLIQKKSATVDLAFYESPEFYDSLHRARGEAGHRPIALVESLGSLMQNSITLVAMLAVLIPYGVWLPGALVVSTVPALYVVLRYALLQYHWRQRATADERRAWYYDWLLSTGESAAEIRLYGLQTHFGVAFEGLRRKLRGERLKLAKAQGRAELAAGVGGLLVSGSAIGWMGWKAVRGQAGLGDLALFYQAFQQGLGLMRSLLDNVGQLYQNSLFLGNLFEFLALVPQVVDPPAPAAAPFPLRDGICFRDVTFRYPGRERALLDHFNLKIPAGRIVTLVGPNGAGKSTLVKLLCRFYDPEAGSIEMDGQDLRGVALEDLRRHCAVLFQQPVHFNASVAENIGMGDLLVSKDQEKIEAAARAAGVDGIVDRLPQGYNNLLGNWFQEGRELSVGEWQRIALARAFLRQAPLIIFDEPTSAMDPWAEADWMKRFRQLVAGRTTLIITHRFTTAMFADAIHVMTEGRIVESGCHEELLARGGMYAQGWLTQTGSQV